VKSRGIEIPTVIDLNGVEIEVKRTDSAITQEESQALYENGVKVAWKFLET
jgi:hypothetical protein